LALQYSISLDNGGPLFNHMLHGENENNRLINDIFHIFKQLKLDPIEFACLKAIVLFRFGIKIFLFFCSHIKKSSFFIQIHEH